MAILLRYGSRDTRHIDFQRVDGLSTDTLVLGHHRVELARPILANDPNGLDPFGSSRPISHI